MRAAGRRVRGCCASLGVYMREQLTARNLAVSCMLSLSLVALFMFWALVVFEDDADPDNVLIASLIGVFALPAEQRDRSDHCSLLRDHQLSIYSTVTVQYSLPV